MFDSIALKVWQCLTAWFFMLSNFDQSLTMFDNIWQYFPQMTILKYLCLLHNFVGCKCYQHLTTQEVVWWVERADATINIYTQSDELVLILDSKHCRLVCWPFMTISNSIELMLPTTKEMGLVYHSAKPSCLSWLNSQVLPLSEGLSAGMLYIKFNDIDNRCGWITMPSKNLTYAEQLLFCCH